MLGLGVELGLGLQFGVGEDLSDGEGGGYWVRLCVGLG